MRRRSLRVEFYQHDVHSRPGPRGATASMPRTQALPSALSLLERLGALHALLSTDARPVMVGRA